MEFKENDKEHFVEIEILYDGQREMREAFTVHMKPDDNMVAEIQASKNHMARTNTFTQKQNRNQCRSAHVKRLPVMSLGVKMGRQTAAGNPVL